MGENRAVMPDPALDGVTHINVFSKGKTPLGRWLSNFQEAPFRHPTFGHFASVEGCWYYIKTGMKHEQLRALSGWQAKSVGSPLHVVLMDEAEFQAHIKAAIMAKLVDHPNWFEKLVDNPLPLEHYYVYGGKAVYAGYEWIIEFLEDVRTRSRQIMNKGE